MLFACWGTIGDMSIASLSATVEDVGPLLAEACARNVSGDLRVRWSDDSGGRHRLDNARVRLLAVDGHVIYLDVPTVSGEPTPIAAGAPLLLFFMLHGKRYSFKTTITRPKLMFAINDRLSIPAMAVEVPHELTVMQRRSDFRVSLASRNIGARCVKACRSLPAVCQLDSVVLRGRVNDLSVGGLNLVISDDEAGCMQVGDYWFVEFPLRTEREPELFFARVQHMRLIPERSTVAVGMAFQDWEDQTTPKRIDAIRRFVCEIQRYQAANVRG